MKTRERVLAILTGVVVGGGLLVTQVVDPALQRWNKANAEVQTLELSVEQSRQLARSIGRLNEERKTLDLGLRPPVGQALVPWVLEHLRSLAESSGLRAGSLTLRYVGARALEAPKATGTATQAKPSARRGAVQKGPFAELRFELKAVGELDRLQAFLVRLAASERHVRVTSLTLAPQRREGLQADLSLVALVPTDALGEEEKS